MKKSTLFILIALAAIVLSTLACANPNQYASSESPAGFWKGLWDGMTAGISWVISLFTPGYGVYEVHNNGVWYDLGFLLGIGAFAGSSSSAASSRRK